MTTTMIWSSSTRSTTCTTHRCDSVMDSLKDDPTFLVSEASFDYYEDLGAGHAHLQWLGALAMDLLVARTNDISTYIEGRVHWTSS